MDDRVGFESWSPGVQDEYVKSCDRKKPANATHSAVFNDRSLKESVKCWITVVRTSRVTCFRGGLYCDPCTRFTPSIRRFRSNESNAEELCMQSVW